MRKIILIDFGIFQHKAIFSYHSSLKRTSNVPPPEYTCLSMMIAALKKIGVGKKDTVIIAVDSKYGSWRRDVEKDYKANRKEARKKFDINWKDMYNRMNRLLKQIDESTPFHIVRGRKLEADDIIAFATEHFAEDECVIVSYDTDFEQLLVRDNVKIFSTHPKAKVCPYKILDLDRQKEIDKAFKSLAQKIRKETADNLVNPVLTEEDYDKRKMCVDLIHLPEFIRVRIKRKLERLEPKEDYDENQIPFTSIRNRYPEIYTTNYRITYEECKRKKEKQKITAQNNRRKSKDEAAIS